MATKYIPNDDASDYSCVLDLFRVNVAYVWCASINFKPVLDGIISRGFKIKAEIIWVKNQIAISRGDYSFQHEPCLYCVRGDSLHNWQGSRKESTVWDARKSQTSQECDGEYNENRDEDGGAMFGHPACKPVSLYAKSIKNNSAIGDLVVDAFAGTGTCLIACERLGRICYCCELLPHYVDIICRRWQRETGEKAIRGDGRKFDDIPPSLPIKK